MALPVLPQDIFDEIINQLTDEETYTLKSCSLVCRSFRRNAQKILFRSIVVILPFVDDEYYDYESSIGEPANLVLIVNGAPHLIKYIQDLKIDGELVYDARDVDEYFTDLADALGTFSRERESFPIDLRSLCLQSLSWCLLPFKLQDALVLLMTVPSLRDITLYGIEDCPGNLIQNLSPLLKYLSLTDITFSSLPTTRNRLPKLESLKIVGIHQNPMEEIRLAWDQKFLRDGMQRIVDITQLKTFYTDVHKNTMPLIEQFLQPAFNSLEHLTLECYIPDSDPVLIDLNQFSHLTDITINFSCYANSCLSPIPPVLMLITKTMKKISHRNMIQNLSFCLVLGPKVDMVDVELVTKDMWQELDTICFIPQLMSSSSFRGITFIIKSPTLTGNCDAFSELVQNKLPETKKANKLLISKVLAME